eukprot:scaffold1695_cov167-Amphora_coffeaeformis.AAC.21
MFPPASAMSKDPAAMSQELKSYSQYAVKRPCATQANIRAALPKNRRVRTAGMRWGMAAILFCMDSSPGGDPIATTACPRSVVVASTWSGRSLQYAPRPRTAVYMLSE